MIEKWSQEIQRQIHRKEHELSLNTATTLLTTGNSLTMYRPSFGEFQLRITNVVIPIKCCDEYFFG